MNSSRRSFVKKTAFVIAGSSVFSHPLFALFKNKKLTVLQLYSVRDDMKANPFATLQQVAKMGFKNVEHANYVDRKFYGYSPKEFRKVLDDLGLKMVSGHTVMRSQHWNAAANDFTS